MSAKFDIIRILNEEAGALGVPDSTTSALSGVPPARLSGYRRGVEKCPNHHEKMLRETWSDLKKLIDAAYPLPLDYRKVDALRQSIKMMKSGELSILVYEGETSKQNEQENLGDAD
jgi:hypothetical protein